MPDEQRTWQVEATDRPRLDAYIAEREPTLTRAQVQRLIERGCVTVNEAAPTKSGVKLRPGDRVAVVLQPRAEVQLVPEPMDLPLLFEDAHLLVLDKPAGLMVHPAPGHPTGTLVHGLLAHVPSLGAQGGERPGIVHRLDKDTTGVMVVAKDEVAYTALSAAFKAKTDVLREYVALCAPSPPQDTGTVSTLYDRHPVDPRRFTSKVQEGRPAVTHWAVVERLGFGAALVRCRLETGRTHQIRVHMSDSGWPLLGDPLYGRRYSGALAGLAQALGRQALHAARLELTHPATGERLRFATEPPADFQALLAALRAAG